MIFILFSSDVASDWLNSAHSNGRFLWNIKFIAGLFIFVKSIKKILALDEKNVTRTISEIGSQSSPFACKPPVSTRGLDSREQIGSRVFVELAGFIASLHIRMRIDIYRFKSLWCFTMYRSVSACEMAVGSIPRDAPYMYIFVSSVRHTRAGQRRHWSHVV